MQKYLIVNKLTIISTAKNISLLQWCFECSQFPCARIKSLDKRYRQNYNVDLIQNGLDAKQDMYVFLQVQRECFTCKSCGGVIDQHNMRCSECGNSL